MADTTSKTLTDKTAVVTGSTSGIGFAIANELLGRGADVMFNGLFFDPKPGKPGKPAADQRAEFTAKLAALRTMYPNQKIELSETNVTDFEQVKKMMSRAAGLTERGRIDILVNNAGIQKQATIESQPVADFDAVIDTNLKSTWYNMKAVLPYMKPPEKLVGGKWVPIPQKTPILSQIVNISSVHGLVSSPERAAYCAAKHGDEALKGVAAAEFAPYNIRVNNINPAFVKTDLALGPIRDKAAELLKIAAGQSIKLSEDDAYKQAEAWRLQLQDGKWIELRDVAKAVANLADFTDTRATGESVPLDNGYIDRAKAAPGGAAHFDKAGPLAIEKLNAAIASKAKTI